jgi:hypothetical protein
MKRKSLSLWQSTKISQELPLEFETKQIEFEHFIIGLCQRNKYSLSQISSADKTAIFVYISRSYAVNLKGEIQVTVQTAGYEQLCITVMLCITTNDSKLPT